MSQTNEPLTMSAERESAVRSALDIEAIWERVKYWQVISDLLRELDATRAKVATLERTVERIREALTKYGQHDYICAIPLRGGDRCDCGLERARAESAGEGDK